MTSFNDGIEAAAREAEAVKQFYLLSAKTMETDGPRLRMEARAGVAENLARSIRNLKRPEPIEEERVERMGAGTMTYPEDVLKAAREAAAKYWESIDAEEFAVDCRDGKDDEANEVQAACIAIMAEHEHWTDFAKEQVKRASEDGYRIGQLEGELKSAEEKFLNRAESLIAKGKDLPFKPSFGMLVIEWMRQIQKEGM